MPAIFPKWFPSGFRLINGLSLTNWFNNPQSSTEDTITATAGGGQANAYQISANNSRVTVCATNADSVKLPPIKNLNGVALEIVNDGAANLAVFPNEASGVQIDGAGAATAVTITAGRRADFYAINGNWYSSGGTKTA